MLLAGGLLPTSYAARRATPRWSGRRMWHGAIRGAREMRFEGEALNMHFCTLMLLTKPLPGWGRLQVTFGKVSMMSGLLLL